MHHTCPYCAQPIIKDENSMGRTVACPNCGRQFKVADSSRMASRAPMWAFGAALVATWILLKIP